MTTKKYNWYNSCTQSVNCAILLHSTLYSSAFHDWPGSGAWIISIARTIWRCSVMQQSHTKRLRYYRIKFSNSLGFAIRCISVYSQATQYTDYSAWLLIYVIIIGLLWPACDSRSARNLDSSPSRADSHWILLVYLFVFDQRYRTSVGCHKMDESRR